MPPRRALRVQLSPDSDEGADSQLLAEAHLHASLQAPPTSIESAERSANLLNAVRAGTSTSNAATMLPGRRPMGGLKKPSGGLKKPSFKSANVTRQRAPRGDAYALPSPSPEKQRAPAPAKPARKVPKLRQTKRNVPQRQAKADTPPAPVPEQQEEQPAVESRGHDIETPRRKRRATDEPELESERTRPRKSPQRNSLQRSSPRVIIPASSDRVPETQSQPTATGETEHVADTQEEGSRNEPEAELPATSGHQESLPVAEPMSDHIQPPTDGDAADTQPEEDNRENSELVITETDKAQPISTAAEYVSNNSKQRTPEPRRTLLQTRNRRQATPIPPTIHDDNLGNSQDSTETRSAEPIEDDDAPPDSGVFDFVEIQASVEQPERTWKGQNGALLQDENLEKIADSDHNDEHQLQEETDPDNEYPAQDDADGNQDDDDDEESVEQEESCQTKHGEEIRKYCDKKTKELSTDEPPLRKLAGYCEGVSEKLDYVHRQKTSAQRKAFREDACGCLADSLMHFLEAVTDCAKQRLGNHFDFESRPVYPPLIPFVKDIVSFYDTIWSWRLRSFIQGARTMKDVEGKFITPLRLLLRDHQPEPKILDAVETASKSKEAEQQEAVEREKAKALEREQLQALEREQLQALEREQAKALERRQEKALRREEEKVRREKEKALRREEEKAKREEEEVMRREEEKAARREQAEALRRERKEAHERQQAEAFEREQFRKQARRWRLVHIARINCDTSYDEKRREHLAIKPLRPLKRSIERDANGVEFERETFFPHKRQTPVPPTSEKEEEEEEKKENVVEWSDEQEEALLAGLERYAGDDPLQVFQRIFQRYCTTGGLLEDFNVTEITAKAVEIRSKLIDDFQSKGWDVPRWIRQIPVLPYG